MPRIRTVSVLALIALCCLSATHDSEPILAGLCRWLDVGETPSCTDHVLLLPGEDSFRPVAAATMVKSGLAADVLIPQTTTTADMRDGLQPTTAELLKQVLQHRGIPPKKIVCLDSASQTTFDDACALAAFLENRPHDRVTVVTNAFHTRRARFIFRRVFGDAAQRFQFVSAPNPGFTERTWWQNRSSANTVLSENLKLAFYVFRYSDPSIWLGSLLGAALLWRWKQRHDASPARRRVQ